MKRTKMENLIDDDLERISTDKSDNESHHDSYDETESGNDIYNYESNE